MNAIPNVGAVYDRPQMTGLHPSKLWAVIDRPYIGNRIHSQPTIPLPRRRSACRMLTRARMRRRCWSTTRRRRRSAIGRRARSAKGWCGWPGIWSTFRNVIAWRRRIAVGWRSWPAIRRWALRRIRLQHQSGQCNFQDQASDVWAH